MPKLQDRAAAALDKTHNPHLTLANEPQTIKVRSYLATWLDGKQRMKTTFVITCCRYLEMVAS